MVEKVLLQASAISKRFQGIQALSSVDFQIKRGQVHALMGANGAGKSTLIKILCGVYQPDSGSIVVEGRETSFRNPFEAKKSGIAYVPQEIAIQPHLEVAENIFLGRQ